MNQNLSEDSSNIISRGYHSIADLNMQFKTHIWGLIEVHNGGYFHAIPSLLDKIEHAQNRFLRELEVSPEQAFLDFNFAPPRIRRNTAVLDLLNKRIIGKCHPTFSVFCRDMRSASRNLDQCRAIQSNSMAAT